MVQVPEGGTDRPANHAEHRRDRRKLANQSSKRQSVIIMHERNGNSIPAVFKSESSALAWIKSRRSKGTLVNADESSGWNDLESKCEMRRINHQEAYSDTALARTWRKAISAAYVAPRWAIITMSAAISAALRSGKLAGRCAPG